MEHIQRISAIIFVSGEEGVSLSELISALNLDEYTIKDTLESLTKLLDDSPVSPICLNCVNDRYRYITKSHLSEDIYQFAQQPLKQKLSRAAIETLAIIAYRQPITRLGIDEIRGVSSQNMIQKLVARNLIETVGHIDAPGRPMLYGVTDYFMDYFNLSSLDDLPEIEPLALNTELLSDSLFHDKLWHLNDTVELENGSEQDG